MTPLDGFADDRSLFYISREANANVKSKSSLMKSTTFCLTSQKLLGNSLGTLTKKTMLTFYATMCNRRVTIEALATQALEIYQASPFFIFVCGMLELKEKSNSVELNCAVLISWLRDSWRWLVSWIMVLLSEGVGVRRKWKYVAYGMV